MKDTFKDPTLLGLAGATALAVFQFLNSFGMMDDIAYQLQLLEAANGPNEKFLIIPKSFELWGVLEPSIQDYIIVGFLIYTLIGLRVHRPREQGEYKPKKKRKRLISVKSGRWLRGGIISLLIGLLSTANKTGRISALVNNVIGGNREGRLVIVDGFPPGFELQEWAPQDYAELTILYLLFLFSLRKGIKIDTSQLVLYDSGTHIERIWVNSDDADRLQRSNVEEGASRINRAVTDLVNMLGAAASLNLAAASLEDGNVKSAFNKWKNLTHAKGKQAKDWKGLSESIDDVGKFKQRDEEE